MKKNYVVFICLLAVVLIVVCQAHAEYHYVDCNAVGEDNGTSWTDAWPSFSDISWNSISPGDTIYICGGPEGESKTYSGQLLVGGSGDCTGYEGDANTITITLQNDPNHNGTVVITNTASSGIVVGGGTKTRRHFTIDGEVADDDVCHIEVTGCMTSAEFQARGGVHLADVSPGYTSYIIIKYVNVYDNGDESGEYGIYIDLAVDSNVPIFEISHCLIHGNWKDQIKIDNSIQGSNFGVVSIHDSQIYEIHDDGISYGSTGIDIYNCVFSELIAENSTMDFTSGGTAELAADDVFVGATSGDYATVVSVSVDTGTWAGGDAAGTITYKGAVCSGDNCFSSENLNVSGKQDNIATTDGVETNQWAGHPDIIEGFAGYTRVYNNTFEDINNEFENANSYIQAYRMNTSVWGVFSNVQIYNNVIYANGSYLDTPTPYGIWIGCDQGSTHKCSGMTDVLIANNTVVGSVGMGINMVIDPNYGPDEISDVIIENNIFHNCGLNSTSTASFSGNAAGGDWRVGSHGDPNTELTIDYNIFSPGSEGSAKFKYKNTIYNTYAEFIAIEMGGVGSGIYCQDHPGDPIDTNNPLLDSNSCYPTSLSLAIDVGVDLSEHFTTDIWSTIRPANDFDPNASDSWDIGAYEYTPVPANMAPKTIRAYSEIDSNTITIIWPANEYRYELHIERREFTDDTSSWAEWVNTYSDTNATSAATAGSYVDPNVSTGIHYEYQVRGLSSAWDLAALNPASSYTRPWWAYQYISTGIAVPLDDQRGNVILLVEKALATTLATEIALLVDDMQRDGWKVYQHDVLACDVSDPNGVVDPNWATRVGETKSIIDTHYDGDPNTDWTIFILGHVPIPYSGFCSPGSHLPNKGAHPADWYYADADSDSWTDVDVNDVSADYGWNWNTPGDGKFDQSTIPGAPEMRIGRVDLRNMGTFGTEADLMEQYLDRNHAWRHKEFIARDRAIMQDSNYNNAIYAGEPYEMNDRYASFFGNINRCDYDDWLDKSTDSDRSYMFAGSWGAGSFTTDYNLGSINTFAAEKGLYAVFVTMHGSYYGNYDSAMHEDVIIWTPLACNGYCLSNYYHEKKTNHDILSMGESIGEELFSQASNYHVSNYYTRYGYIYEEATTLVKESMSIYIQLLGDPTLRYQVVPPPTGVEVTASGNDNIISWTAPSDETGIVGYHVYRAPTTDHNDFTRLTETVDDASPYTDTNGALESYDYIVRTIKLESSPRSYYNASQGIIAGEGEEEEGEEEETTYTIQGVSIN